MGKAIVCVACILVILFVVGSIIDADATGGRGGGWGGPQRTVDPQMAAAVQALLADGSIHSVDVAGHTVRIDPLIWGQLALEQKQQTVIFFREYFNAATGYQRVTIKSNRNDTRLGAYTPFGGVTIDL